MRRLVLALGLGCLVAPAVAGAGGMRDLADAWLIPADQVETLLTGAQDSRRHWYLTLAQGRLFELAELPQFGANQIIEFMRHEENLHAP